MGIPPIVVPRRPAQPFPPFVASVPQDVLTVPTDDALLARLRALNMPEAKAVIAAYQAFGNSALFQTKLIDALVAINTPVDNRLLIHISRLGAEAFVLDLGVANNKVALLGFIDDPDNLAQGRGGQAEQFLHFAVRRLIEIAELNLAPDLQRQQMDKAINLFAFFQAELQRDFSLLPITESVLVEYRRLLFDVIETHCQALLDGLFVKPRDTSGFSAAVKQLADHVQVTTATDVSDKTPPAIALYRIERDLFRDYFTSAAASDFRFSFYSRKSSPVAGQGPEISFHSVIRKRHEQLIFLDDLRAGPHPAARSGAGVPRPSIGWQQQELPPAQPEPPKLHDNASWQAWARNMWDTAEVSKPVLRRPNVFPGKLEDICNFVSRYFHAFTVHVPYDLAEGSREANYLTRTYPRAITGCLVHDCVVYAIRWVFILGRLFASPSMPREMSKPRIAIIEMPSHVGVMIRASLQVSGDVLIAANNQDFEVSEINKSLSDSDAAEEVAKGMYPGLTTAIAIREIKANPTDATALWNEIAKLSDKKLKLPYDDPSEPFLNYLLFNAQDAAIAKQLADELGRLWRDMQQKLDAIKDPAKRRGAIAKELAAYRAAIEPLFTAAEKAFNTNVVPLIGVIRRDLDANLDRIPKDAEVVEVQDGTGWKRAKDAYQRELQNADKSLDLSRVDPGDFFPDDGFPPDVQ